MADFFTKRKRPNKINLLLADDNTAATNAPPVQKKMIFPLNFVYILLIDIYIYVQKEKVYLMFKCLFMFKTKKHIFSCIKTYLENQLLN